MNSPWEYFILCSICSMRYATCVFIPKQRNCGHLDLTKQSSGNYTEICQLLFKYLFLSESVDVALWYVFSLVNQTHLSESEFLQDLHSKTMFHVRYVKSGY